MKLLFLTRKITESAKAQGITSRSNNLLRLPGYNRHPQRHKVDFILFFDLSVKNVGEDN